MAKHVIFYLIEQSTPNSALSIREQLACKLAAQAWRSGKKIVIACTDQAQAERLDEALWQNDPNEFVPHNLAGEGPSYGSPVELCWPEKRGNHPRDLLICLTDHFNDFATAFHHVIDFVPYDTTLKQHARERYKIYRTVGFQLTTQTAPSF